MHHQFEETQATAMDGTPVLITTCSVCTWTFILPSPSPIYSYPPCPGEGIKLFNYWGSDFGHTPPENFMAATMLSKSGYKLKKDQPKRAAVWIYSRKEYIWLYDRDEADKRPPLTEKQRAGQEKARQTRRTCTECEKVFEDELEVNRFYKRRLCNSCFAGLEEAAIIQWARELLTRPTGEWVILDTETTGLSSGDEIIELGILSSEGEVLFETRLKPTQEISEGAFSVHNITEEMLAGAPSFTEVYPRVKKLLLGKTVIAYNSDFDEGILDATCYRYKLKQLPNLRSLKTWEWYVNQKVEPPGYLLPLTRDQVIDWECAMEAYSQFVGDWYDYQDGEYRWQPLPGACHSAITDCRAVLKLIKRMAATPTFKEKATIMLSTSI